MSIIQRQTRYLELNNVLNSRELAKRASEKLSEEQIEAALKNKLDISFWTHNDKVVEFYDTHQLDLLIEKGAPGEAWKYAESACNYDLEQLNLLIEKGAPWEAWAYAKIFKNLASDLKEWCLDNNLFTKLPTLSFLNLYFGGLNQNFKKEVVENKLKISNTKNGSFLEINPSEDLSAVYFEDFSEYYVLSNDSGNQELNGLTHNQNMKLKIQISTNYKVKYDVEGDVEFDFDTSQLNACQSVGTLVLGTIIENSDIETRKSQKESDVYVSKVNELLETGPHHLKALVYSQIINESLKRHMKPDKRMFEYALAYFLSGEGRYTNTTGEAALFINQFVEKNGAGTLFEVIENSDIIKESINNEMIYTETAGRLIAHTTEQVTPCLKYSEDWKYQIGPLTFYQKNNQIEIENGLKSKWGHKR